MRFPCLFVCMGIRVRGVCVYVRVCVCVGICCVGLGVDKETPDISFRTPDSGLRTRVDSRLGWARIPDSGGFRTPDSGDPDSGLGWRFRLCGR